MIRRRRRRVVERYSARRSVNERRQGRIMIRPKQMKIPL